MEWHGSRTLTIMKTTMDEGMEDYSDQSSESPEVSSGETAKEESSETESIDQEEAESSTAVVSNKVLSPGGEPLKEGDTITLTIVKNFGDESEIKYAKETSGKKVQAPRDMMAEADSELDEMNV